MSTHRRTRTRHTPGADETAPVWNVDAIRALGVSTDLATAAQIFNLSLATAYRLVKRDAFPVPVIRAGSHYRIPVAPILTALGLASPNPDATSGPSSPDVGPFPGGYPTSDVRTPQAVAAGRHRWALGELGPLALIAPRPGDLPSPQRINRLARIYFIA